MCVKTLLTNGDMQKKIKEHAGEVWQSNVIVGGAHDNFPHSAYGQKQKKEGRHKKIETLTGERMRNH